jgi:hypothetical protein
MAVTGTPTSSGMAANGGKGAAREVEICTRHTCTWSRSCGMDATVSLYTLKYLFHKIMDRKSHYLYTRFGNLIKQPNRCQQIFGKRNSKYKIYLAFREDYYITKVNTYYWERSFVLSRVKCTPESTGREKISGNRNVMITCKPLAASLINIDYN